MSPRHMHLVAAEKKKLRLAVQEGTGGGAYNFFVRSAKAPHGATPSLASRHSPGGLVRRGDRRGGRARDGEKRQVLGQELLQWGRVHFPEACGLWKEGHRTITGEKRLEFFQNWASYGGRGGEKIE